MNISEFLKCYTSDRDMSLQQLCNALEYKSKTSIDRILSGNVGIDALKKFRDRLESSLGMTESEKESFSQIMSNAIYGEDRSGAFHGLHDMLSHRISYDYNDFHLTSDTEDDTAFSDYLNAHCIRHIRIYNCIYPQFPGVIQTILKNTDVEIEHFIALDKSEKMLIQVLSGTLDLMPYPNYKAYSYNGVLNDSSTPNGLILSDMMILETDAAGAESVQYKLVVPDGYLHGKLIEINGSGLPLPSAEHFLPLNRSCPAAQSFDEFLNYCSQLANLEANTATFDLKPDICIMYVPFDILYSVFISSDLPDSFKTPEAISKLSTVFTRRVANTYNKRKPTIAIMSYDALQSFANTGICSDHMPGLRPFTVEERIRIFDQLLNACKTNPWFEIYIRKDNYLEDYNICCYAGNGYFMASKDSNYLSAHSPEIILTPPPSFYTLFETYYREELIKNHCRSASDSRTILRELSDSLKRICNQ